MNIIYHNPKCSKSRQTLALLNERGIEPEIVEYLNEPPMPRELDGICTMLGVEPTALIRNKEARFKEMGLSLDDERSRLEWITLMVTNPILIERPIVVAGDKAAIGRPPENVLGLFE